MKMCQGMKEWLEEKYEMGHAEGHTEAYTRSVENIMRNFNLSIEEACRGIGISVDEYYLMKSVPLT